MKSDEPIDEYAPYMVHIWYAGGSYQTIDTDLDAKTAIERAKTITDRVHQIPGAIEVCVTDNGDFTVFKWTKSEGLVYPTRSLLKKGREE